MAGEVRGETGQVRTVSGYLVEVCMYVGGPWSGVARKSKCGYLEVHIIEYAI